MLDTLRIGREQPVTTVATVCRIQDFPHDDIGVHHQRNDLLQSHRAFHSIRPELRPEKLIEISGNASARP